MTKEETRKIIAIIIAAYPNYKPADLAMTVEVWHKLLGQWDYAQVGAGLQAYITQDSSGFAPTIGQIIDKMAQAAMPQDSLPAQAAWEMVSRALRNSGYNSESEFARLPDAVQRAVGSARQLRAWALDENFNEGICQARFAARYNEVLERDADRARLPQAAQAAQGAIDAGRQAAIAALGE